MGVLPSQLEAEGPSVLATYLEVFEQESREEDDDGLNPAERELLAEQEQEVAGP